MKFGKTIALDNASWNFPRVETMIIESTYGGKEDITSPREEAEARLLGDINHTLQEGGHVLLPVPTIGISQELLLFLAAHKNKEGKNNNNNKDGDGAAPNESPLKKARILVEKIIADATSVYEAYPEFLSKELRQAMLESESNPFIWSNKSPVVVESASLRRSKPSIILAPSSMLTHGPSVSYLRQIAKDSKNRLILVSYQANDTPGRAIQEGARQIVIQGEEIKLQCQVDKIDGFASHSDYNQLLNYVGRLRPKLRRILVNHGERPKAQNLASIINKMFKIQTQHPLVQEAIKLL
jgi:predicted metal-dependent RNase